MWIRPNQHSKRIYLGSYTFRVTNLTASLQPAGKTLEEKFLAGNRILEARGSGVKREQNPVPKQMNGSAIPTKWVVI